MPQLTNSRRVMYKATHVAIVPSTSASDQKIALSLTRALPKASFARRLSVTSSEIPLLSAAVKKLRGSRSAKRKLTSAVNALARVTTDASPTAFLLAARKFTTVDNTALLKVSTTLKELRSSAHETGADALKKLRSDFAKRPVPQAPTTQGPRGVPSIGNRLFTAAKQTAGKGLGAKNFQAVRFPPAAKPSLNYWSKRASSMASDASTTGAATLPGTQGDAIAWASSTDHPQLQLLRKTLDTHLSARATMSGTLSEAALKSGLYRLNQMAIDTGAQIEAFKETLPIEPVGRLHLERMEMTPVGIERGELIHSIPMTPQETVNVSHKEWATTSQEFESIVSDEMVGYSEKGVSEKSDVSQATDSESKHSSGMNVGVSLSASYASVTLSSNFGYNTSSESQQSQKDSRAQSSQITSKAASRTRKDHKTTFKVASAAGTEDMAVRVITNPTNNPIRVDYYQLVRKWKIDLIRYGLRMTYDIVIPSPGALLMTKMDELRQLTDQLNAPFEFGLTPEGIDRLKWMDLAAQWQASVDPPPADTMHLEVIKQFQAADSSKSQYDSLQLDVDAQYIVKAANFGAIYQATHNNQNPANASDSKNSIFDVMGEPPGPSVGWQGYGSTLDNAIGRTGTISIVFYYYQVESGAAQVDADLQLTDEAFAAWQMKAWSTMKDAALNIDQLNRTRLAQRQKALNDEIAAFDPLSLRQMEREEIMKGVLKWLFGPTFDLVPQDIAALFTPTDPDANMSVSLDVNANAFQGTDAWGTVMQYGEFIKYIHNAIEWENVLYINYPYFWDSPANWKYKLFLNHPDPAHRMFLRSGAARVVLTIRPGFEDSFTTLMEQGSFSTIGPHPYVSIAQEIQNFAQTNYPGLPPANPDLNVRPLLYLEQRRTWKTMQYLVQLLQLYRADAANDGDYPDTAAGLAALKPYLSTANATNKNLNTQLAIDDPIEQLPTYTSVPLTDDWGKPFFYQCPGDTGDYDLISYGADGVAGGEDKNADISANADGSLIATWYEYTPTSALDIAMTTNMPTVQPAEMA